MALRAYPRRERVWPQWGMRLRIHLIVTVLALLLGGCAQLLGPQQLSWSEAELQQMLQRRFPMERRVLEVLDVQIAPPALSLLPERHRVALDLQVQGRDRVFASRFTARLNLESALRYEPADQSLRLSELRLTRIGGEGASRTEPALLQRLGAVVAESLLEGAVVYRLPPEQLERLRLLGYQPDRVEIDQRGLTLTLRPRT